MIPETVQLSPAVVLCQAGQQTHLVSATYTRRPVKNEPRYQDQRVEAPKPPELTRFAEELPTLTLLQQVHEEGPASPVEPKKADRRRQSTLLLPFPRPELAQRALVQASFVIALQGTK